MVNVFARVLYDDVFAFRLVEGNHHSCEQSFLVNVAEGFLYSSLACFSCVEIVGLVVEVIDEITVCHNGAKIVISFLFCG